MDNPPPNARASSWITAAISVIAVVVTIMAALAICATAFRWRGFWPAAATPFATATAGMAALAVGALALYNGERQRSGEAEHHQEEARRWRESQDHTVVDADRAHDRETDRELRTRFTTSTAQLADDKPTIRRAGAYALAALADDWHNARGNDTERQVCIDVLCGYLTTPNRTYGATEDLDHGLPPEFIPEDDPSRAGEDGPVRTTIAHLLLDHRDSTDPAISWAATTYTLENADLRSADLTRATLTNIDLMRAKLGRADLTGANLSGADLTRTDLTRAQLRGANLTGTDVSNADLTQARLVDANLTRAILSFAVLNGANLIGANLFDAYLIGANLTGAILSRADLRGAYLHGADLTGANLYGADLTGARHDTKTTWPDGFTPPGDAENPLL